MQEDPLVQVPVLLLRVHMTASRPGTVDWVDETEASVAARPSVFSVVCNQTAREFSTSYHELTNAVLLSYGQTHITC